MADKNNDLPRVDAEFVGVFPAGPGALTRDQVKNLRRMQATGRYFEEQLGTDLYHGRIYSEETLAKLVNLPECRAEDSMRCSITPEQILERRHPLPGPFVYFNTEGQSPQYRSLRYQFARRAEGYELVHGGWEGLNLEGALELLRKAAALEQ